MVELLHLFAENGLVLWLLPPSHVQALLPDPSCLKLNSVEHQDGGRVLIAAAAFGSVAYCPACHHASHSLHSRYSRALHDLPWQGSTVGLRLDVRRFRCRAHDCLPRHIRRDSAHGFSEVTVDKRVDYPRRSA